MFFSFINIFDRVSLGSVLFFVPFSLASMLGFSQTFTNLATGIPALTNARAEWVDFNNDNKPDLFISGTNNLGALHTAVYLNNGDNTFNVIPLTALTDIAVDFGDYNCDSFIDILISGITATSQKKTILYRNSTGGAFVNEPMGLQDLSKGGIIWRDLDGDTDLDIVLTGLDAANDEHTLVYLFDNGQYNSIVHSLPALSNGQLLALDANNDGIDEIMLTGLDASGLPVSIVITWHSNNTTEIYSNTLPGTAFNSVSSGDYNSDGYADIFIAGLANEALEESSLVLQNNGLNNFTNVASSFVNVSSASVDAGDVNNDGFLDVILTGIDDGGFKHFEYYQNSASFSFNEMTHSLPNIYNGDVAITDYEGDGDADFFQIGNSDISFQSNLYISDQSSSTANLAPGVPAALDAFVIEDSVRLSWSAATDDHTASASLTYNVYIAREQNGEDFLVSPLSDVVTGYHKKGQPGNAGHKTFKSFHGLPEGRYYWSVQAIDHSNIASAFASEGTFAVCYSVSLGADTTICQDDVLELTMGDANDEVNWYSKTDGLLEEDNNSLSHTIIDNDTIIVELTRPYNCTIKDTLVVAMSLPPLIDLGENTAVCSGETFEVSVAASVDSANWYNPLGELLLNSHAYVYTVAVKDTIIVHAYNEHRCVTIDSIIVDVHALPDFSVGANREICFKENTLFEVTGTWPMVNWYSTQLGELQMDADTYDFDVVATDTIVAEVTDGNGCVNYDSAIVEMLPLPVISLGDDVSVCFLEEADLHLTGTGTTVEWLDADHNLLSSNVADYSYQVLQQDTTIVKVVDENLCVSYDSITVFVLPLPAFDIGVDTAICFEENILLEAGAGYQRVDWYSLTTGEIVNADSWFFNYHVLETDTLIAKVLHPNSCINYDSIAIEMLPVPDISLGSDQNICFGERLSLQIDGMWDEVNWYTENDLILQPDDPSFEFRVEQSLPLWVEVFNAHRCVSYDTLQVNVLSIPQFDLGAGLSYCDGDTVSLSVGSIAESYSWTDEDGNELSNSSEYSYKAETSKKLWLTVIDDLGCVFTDSVMIAVHKLPEFTVRGDLVICENDTASLDTDFPNSSIVWFDADTEDILGSGNSLVRPFSESLNISTSVTNVHNCNTTQTVMLTVHDRPFANAGEDQLLCYDEVSILGEDPAEGNIYAWSPVDFLNEPSLANPRVIGTATRAYALTVTNEDNCSSVDSVHVEVNPEIIVEAGSDDAICIGDSITLGGLPTAAGSTFAYSYQWMAEDQTMDGNNANPVVSPETTTWYYVFVTSGKCEVEYDSIEVVVNPLPQISIVGDQSIGAGSSVMLYADGGKEYRWAPFESLDDAGSASPVASPLRSTKYVVEVTDANHCTDTASVDVFVQNKLFIPNTFSPNGDGSNDVFKLYGSGVAEIVFSVFDQKGNRVYHTGNASEIFETGWDGEMNGDVLKDDIYIWTLDGKFHNGEPLQFEGKNSGIIKLMK